MDLSYSIILIITNVKKMTLEIKSENTNNDD